MNKIAVIVAGGSGTRMGFALPKQFIEINEKPILVHTIAAFLQAYSDMQIILVLPEAYEEKGRELINQFYGHAAISITTGGATRFQSVQNGLKLINESSVIFVHDAVRCLVGPDLIRRCYDQAIKESCAVPAVAARDSIRVINKDRSEAIDRNRVRILQTPQTFMSEIILPAFKQPFEESFTDEATVVEKSGVIIHLVEGEETNFKITTPMDLDIAEKVLAARKKV